MAALSQQRMMQAVAARSVREESASDGLVILRAVYGHASAVRCEDKVKQMEGAMEVTTALQFLVKQSRLRMYAGSKREYMGLWVGEGEDEVVLLVRYAFRGKVWEIVVKDEEPLYLPAFRAMELGEQSMVH